MCHREIFIRPHLTTCEWTELSTSWTATASEPIRICILNQNNATGGNDFALDNFSITAEDGTELTIETALGVATATDECGEVIPTFEDSEVVGDCETIITRTWTAIDSCGNESSCVQTITVTNDDNPSCLESECEDCTDSTPPVIEGVEVFIVGECGEISIEALGITATDFCGDDVTITFEEFKFSPGCLGTLQRTYTATDKCGNTSTAFQIIDLTNNNGPIMECPEDETYQCITEVPAPVEPVVSHGCDLEIVSLELNETMEGDSCSMIITRVWTATDACGGVSTCVQTIRVEDTEAPEAPVAPVALAVQCADDVPAAEELTAEDNCSGTITGVPTDVVTPGDCPNSFVVTRTWTFTDECDNTSTVSQTITVEDTEAPVAPEAPEALAVQCAEDVPAAAELTAEDNCSGTITGVPTDVVTPGDCPNSFVVTRTWTFTDECDNTSTVSQTITVEDTEAPVAPEAPEALAVQCADDVPAAEELTAEDNCSGTITSVPTDVVTPGDCPNSFVVTRTWTFTDECDNTSTVSQTITVEDTEAPVAPEAPEALAVQCADDVPAAEELTAEDNCSGTITGVPTDVVTPGDCPNSFVVTRTWTFTDECDNTSTVSQTITVEDTEAPVAPEAPEALAVQCADDVPAAEELTAEDNCSGTITSVPTDVVTPGDCPNSFVVTRTWTFTDECDNTSTVSQTITVEDTEAPVAPAPAPLAVQCAEDVPAAEELTAEDNCSGTITSAPTDVVTPGDCPNSFVVTRTWTFTDECDNTSTVSQTITVEDTEAPVAPEAPEALAVQCAEDVPAAEELTAEDNCSGTITSVPTDVVTPGDCPNSFVVTRTWTFTDECDNTSTVSQTITVEDTEAPEAPEGPEALAVQCADDVPAAEELTAADNCSGTITGVPTDVVTPGDCPNSFVVTRTWTFTDECDNVSTVSQTITVEDTEAPVAPPPPAPVTIECGEAIPNFEPVWTDNCDDDLEIEITEEELPNECGYTFVKTFRAEDDCGNSATISQIVFVTDTEAPTFVMVPEDLTVECRDDLAELAIPEATDNCQEPVVTCVETEDLDECGNGVITVTCTAVDVCGNLATTSYTITTNDTTAPELVGVPEDLVLDCDTELPEPPEVTAIDICDNDVTVTFTENIIETGVVECVLSQPGDVCHDTENWSMVMFGLPVTEYYSNVEANFVEFADGTAHLTGTVSDNTNPDGGFIIDVMFENGMNWDEWSSQDFPTSFKDECGTGNHEDWTYYLMTTGAATMTGYGNLAGSQFNLIHAPVNKLFAYQVGVGASNVNANYGNGGWFVAEGTLVVDGVSYPQLMVAGDFAFDGDCCPSYEVERKWTATDCSGNTSEATQSIIFEQIDTVDSAFESVPIEKEINSISNPTPTSGLFESDKAIIMSGIAPNPTIDYASFSYVVNKPMHVQIEVVDISGKLVQKVFEGNVSSDISHVHQIRTENMKGGVYLIRIVSEKEMTITRLVVLH